MKKQITFFILGSLLFFILLYKNTAGINFLIYGAAMVAMSFAFNPKRSTRRIIIATLLLISTLSAAIYGPTFAIPLSIVLFLLLGYYQCDINGRLWISPFYIFVNYLLEILQVPKLFQSTGMHSISNKFLRLITLILIPIAVLVLFVIIYAQINTQFSDFLNSLQLPQIDIDTFVILGMAVFFNLGFWYFQKWFKEPQIPENIATPTEAKIENEDNKIWAQSGIVVFSILNLLLITLLAFDFQEVYCHWDSQSGADLSNTLHLSVTAVIGSIILGVALIFAYLNGTLNFVKSSMTLKGLMIFWMILNIFLLISSGLKNQIYISLLGLTEKRLGVYAFIFLTVIGLIYTNIKVEKNKTPLYLIERMGWVVLVFVTLIMPINWSNIITKYNVNQFEKHKGTLDINYLETLNFNDVTLYELSQKHPELFEQPRSNSYNSDLNNSPKNEINRKITNYKKEPFFSTNFYLERLKKFQENNHLEED